MDSIREYIHGISVVERLSAHKLVEVLSTTEGGTVIYMVIRLNNPDQLLAWVVEVELNLVGRRTNRLITSELELLNQILMRILSHASALISVKENIVNIEGSGYKRLVVSSSSGFLVNFSGSIHLIYSPEALINGTEVKINLNFVVLKSNEGNGETRVAAEPELKRNIESGLGKGLAGSTDLVRGIGGTARSVNLVKFRVGNVSELSGVTNHLVVTTSLLRSKSELIPNVHPVTILAVDALSSNLNFYLLNELLTRAIKPAGMLGVILTNFRKSYLKISAVGQITIARNGASYSAAEISLAIESLLNRLHSEVGMSAIGDLPEGDLRVTGKVYVLGAIGD